MARSIEGKQEEIIRRHRAGEGLREIGRALDLHASSVAGLLERTGVRERLKARHLSPEGEKELAERYAAKEPTAKLAEAFGIAKATVREIAKRHGCAINPRGQQYRPFTNAEVAEIAARWHAGESQAEIGRGLGCHQIIISRVLRQHGYEPVARRPTGEKHGSWKGGRTMTPGGYWQVGVRPDDPFAVMRNRQGYVPEHRLLMAQSLGRPLESREHVHHINGDPGDNRLENLQLRSGPHGKGVTLRCACCGSTNIVAVKLSED